MAFEGRESGQCWHVEQQGHCGTPTGALGPQKPGTMCADCMMSIHHIDVSRKSYGTRAGHGIQHVLRGPFFLLHCQHTQLSHSSTREEQDRIEKGIIHIDYIETHFVSNTITHSKQDSGMPEGARGGTEDGGRQTVNILMSNAIGKEIRNGMEVLVKNSYSSDSNLTDEKWVVRTIRTFVAHVKTPKAASEGLKALADVVEAMTKQQMVDVITEIVMKDIREIVEEMRTMAQCMADMEQHTAETLAKIRSIAEAVKAMKQNISTITNMPPKSYTDATKRDSTLASREGSYSQHQTRGQSGEGSVKSAAWIFPIECHLPAQQYAHMKIKFRDRDQVNKAIQDRLFISSKIITAQKDVQEPPICYRCHSIGDSHCTNNCTVAQKDICRHCRQEHRAAQCPHPHQKWAWAGNQSCELQQQQLEAWRKANPDAGYRIPTAQGQGAGHPIHRRQGKPHKRVCVAVQAQRMKKRQVHPGLPIPQMLEDKLTKLTPQIFQLNMNKSQTGQNLIINSIASYNIILQQELWIDHDGWPRAIQQFNTIYPIMHDTQKDKTQAVIFLSTQIMSDHYIQLSINSPDVVGVNVKCSSES
ncbi:RNA-directed DNA polymerase from transposon X-element [Salix suchowensis]|nr:RNA-directed DNA polymerase from transposon X-element [Salix suchowensis]